MILQTWPILKRHFDLILALPAPLEASHRFFATCLIASNTWHHMPCTPGSSEMRDSSGSPCTPGLSGSFCHVFCVLSCQSTPQSLSSSQYLSLPGPRATIGFFWPSLAYNELMSFLSWRYQPRSSCLELSAEIEVLEVHLNFLSQVIIWSQFVQSLCWEVWMMAPKKNRLLLKKTG